MWYASLLCILLNAPLAVAFYGKCTQAVNSLFISSFGATYIDVGTIVTVFTPTSSNRVLLTATLTAYFTSIQYLQCTIFRDGVNLVPDALQGVDATFTTETTPLSMTYLDSPPASATYTYSVRCRGEGYVSFNGNPRQLSAVLLAGTYTNSAKVNNNPATITATNFVTMGLDTTANVANQENLLVLATTNFYPSVDGDGNNFARYTILRSSFNLAIGGVHPLLYTSSLLRNKRRSETMIFMDSPAPASNIPYSVGVSKGGAGTFTTGTVAETGTIAVIAVPIARSGVFTTTGNTLVTVNAWVNLGFSVTVVPTVTTDKVLVTVMLYARCETAACQGAFTIARNNVLLGESTYGILTCSWASQVQPSIKVVTLAFLDAPATGGVAVTYTPYFRTFSGSINVNEAPVTKQVAAIVVDGNMPGQSPTAFPTFIPPTKTPTAAPTATPGNGSPTFKVSNGFDFAARDPRDGSVLMWGERAGSAQLLTPVFAGASSVVATRGAYAALKTDGSIAAFGVSSHIAGSAAFATGVNPIPIDSLVATEAAFAGVNRNGKVFAFGSWYDGGDVVNNAHCNGFATQLSSGVVSIVASSAAFAALKADGTVFAWGNSFAGGGVSSLTRTDLVGVQKIFASATAFAALLTSGAVKVWGDKFGGGDATVVASALTSGVLHIVASQSVFIAYKADTSIVVWGNPYYGGVVSTSVIPSLTSGVKYVTYTGVAAAALKTDGSVVAWGDANKGGSTSPVAASLVNIASLYSNRFAFAALTTSGRVIVWGDAANGGSIPSDLVSTLSSGVTAIYSTHRAFAALKGATGQLVLWGNPAHGADADAAGYYINSGVRTVCANDAAFTAILQDGRAVAWGHPSSVTNPGLLPASTKFAGVTSCA